ncbi:MAG: radical SAM protein [Candidatus Bathyarchaeota archaeon]|nr:radical SAM protein [Candidatus Bathyarchaeota archaeon]
MGVCANCIRDKFENSLPYILEACRKSREKYGLPVKPPKTTGGIPCNLCSNECVIGVGEKGFCGIRENVDGKLKTFSKPDKALLYTYPDKHPTNCCASWFCPAGTGLGYPKYAYNNGAELGYYNLAVFFYGCNFNCLFCQNTSHKNFMEGFTVSVENFVEEVLRNQNYSCICYFGGSPEPQLPFAIEASKKVLEAIGGKRIMRICFEWNGCGNPKLVREAAELAFTSGGNLKFDLKTYNVNLSLALSGVSNDRAYKNFEMVAKDFYEKRKGIPVLTATTLLVPWYVDNVEVENIAKFIAEINPEIPYSLLVFHPEFMMKDLPITPPEQVKRCYEAAKRYLKNVHIGNLHLLRIYNLLHGHIQI